jgi:hypothetical protein
MSPLVKTKRQANFKDFKRFGAFKGLVEQKNVVFTSFVCQLGFFGTRGPTNAKKIVVFCSIQSEFEKFLVCERILINVKTKRQANFKDFKRFEAFKGLVEQKKNVVFNSFL